MNLESSKDETISQIPVLLRGTDMAGGESAIFREQKKRDYLPGDLDYL